jgi:hypothetical protein
LQLLQTLHNEMTCHGWNASMRQSHFYVLDALFDVRSWEREPLEAVGCMSIRVWEVSANTQLRQNMFVELQHDRFSLGL